ncbi:hypothetical protein CRENBAI_001400 [Crenichthys baileyi]|uniref:Secreted protein n=1 Tax=Crenichthys baileyi TaxID=28760 RepID=A0AAV9QSM3_9TELE
MIKPIFVLRIPILSSAFVWIRIKLAASCPLRLLSQATSVPCPPSNTRILNLTPPGDLTTTTHEIFVRFVPDCIIKTVFVLLPPPECSLYVGQSYFEYDRCLHVVVSGCQKLVHPG